MRAIGLSKKGHWGFAEKEREGARRRERGGRVRWMYTVYATV